MIANLSEKVRSLACYLRFLFVSAEYRTAKRVREQMVFINSGKENGYYICPRCRCTLDREYVSFCDRCGQKLDWRRCQTARVVYPEGFEMDALHRL